MMKLSRMPLVHSLARGFSLVELLIVMAIVGVLAAVAAPLYKNYTIDVRMADMQRYALVLTQDQDAFFEENGRFYGLTSSEKAKVAIPGGDERGFYQYHNWTSTSQQSSIALVEIFITEDLYPGAKRNRRFIYEGNADSFGNITWKCVQHKSSALRLDEEYVPTDCQDLFTFF